MGSSPLTRGAQRGRGDRGFCAGLIPAHAGSTWWWFPTGLGRSAHPRSRGEHEGAVAPGHAGGGSSPLTRGARAAAQHRDSGSRLIPAHAGSTRWVWFGLVWCGAHPRSRGEHCEDAASVPSGAGSSPLTRGAPIVGGFGVAVVGLIPAHAGSTRTVPTASPSRRAHPRSRGEHGHHATQDDPYGGSSPLTRGALPKGHEGASGRGLIPAHAGSTLVGLVRVPTHWAHPRSRGEHRVCLCRG